MDWAGRLTGRRLVVEVPATTANLGAGYDCLGLALDPVNVITVEPILDADGRIELTVEGEGEEALPADRTNHFVATLEHALVRAGGELPAGLGWAVAMRNEIPLARGLGSSAAATVGALVAANALAGGPFDDRALFEMAAEIEGHGDNAAAALLGGLVVVDGRSERPMALRFDAPAALECVLFVPDRELSTRAMRACLPAAVPFADAAANLGRVAIGVAGLSQGRLDVLDRLTRDALHEPYRARLYPELPQLVRAARAAGALGACLSGAGSTIIAFTDSPARAQVIGAALIDAAGEAGIVGRIRIAAARNERASVREG
jgi:homoserine kinase